MPTYDYGCNICGHEFELVQKMSDPPRKRCPKCRSKVERKIGAGAGLIFKGSGFYITDYRSSEYKSREKSEREAAKSSSGSSSGSSNGKSGDKSSDKSGDKKATTSKKSSNSPGSKDGGGSKSADKK